MSENESETRAVTLRLPNDLVAAMDRRVEDVRMNRNAWLTKTLTWVLTYLPTGIKAPERDRIATEAPVEVTGSQRELAESEEDRAKRLAGRRPY